MLMMLSLERFPLVFILHFAPWMMFLRTSEGLLTDHPDLVCCHNGILQTIKFRTPILSSGFSMASLVASPRSQNSAAEIIGN